MQCCAVIGASLLLGAGATVGGKADDAQTAAVIAYLATHAIPIESVEAGSGFADLMPLKPLLRDARVVGLGESTHGTREFFQLRHRLLEFLVKELDFNVLAIESSYVACIAINEYVVHGRGEAAAALAGQKFWVWDTEEIAETIRWLRDYNKERPESRRVRFMGYDLQAYEQAFEVITGFLKRVAPDRLAAAQAAFLPLRLNSAAAKEAFAARDRAARIADAARLEALVDLFETRRAGFVESSSVEEFERVLQHVRVLYQYHATYGAAGSPAATVAARDRYMAENIRYLMDATGASGRIVVWGHNVHVANIAASSVRAASMGHFLRQWYGPQYYVLGFTFNEGSFQSLGAATKGQSGYALREFTLPPAQEGTLSWYFERAHQGRPWRDYLVNFRSAPTGGPFADWLAAPHRLVIAGSMFSEDWEPSQYMSEVVAGREYDGMVFIQKTTRARPNPTGMRPLPQTKGSGD